MDADTGRIVAAVLTDKEADDGAQVGPLLDQIDGPIASLTGDGAYDQAGVYSGVAARHPEAAVIVPPRSTAVPSDTAETAPTQRDRHLQRIADKGRMGWQKASGYNRRARIEATIGRFKGVIGDGLRSRTDQRRATEVEVAVHALNRMLELGRPESVVRPNGVAHQWRKEPPRELSVGSGSYRAAWLGNRLGRSLVIKAALGG
jgi:hypothetical protein